MYGVGAPPRSLGIEQQIQIFPPRCQCPGSDVRITLQHSRKRTSEPKGH